MAPRPVATEFPLPLCQVLEEEIEALLPEAGAGAGRPQPDGPWEFTPDQIRPGELPGLLARLRDPGDEVCRWLREQLSPNFCQQLANEKRQTGQNLPGQRHVLCMSDFVGDEILVESEPVFIGQSG